MTSTAGVVHELPVQPVSGPPALPSWWRVVDLQADPPPIRWAVEDFAARGTLTILAAPTATGKTWFALQLADGVERGAEVAGLQCHAGLALYIDAENGDGIIGRRLRDAGLDPGRMTYVHAHGLRLNRPEALRELAERIRAVGATFVVLDSLRRLAADAREDSSDSMAAIIGGLANVARETDAALLLQHHRSTKHGAAAVRGSSAIEDQADVVFSLERARVRDLRQLTARKYRLGPEPAPRTLRFREQPPGFVIAQPVASGLAARLDDLVDRVRADGSWTTGQLGDALALDMTPGSADRRRLERALRDVIAAGAWARLARGRYAPADG